MTAQMRRKMWSYMPCSYGACRGKEMSEATKSSGKKRVDKSFSHLRLVVAQHGWVTRQTKIQASNISGSWKWCRNLHSPGLNCSTFVWMSSFVQSTVLERMTDRWHLRVSRKIALLHTKTACSTTQASHKAVRNLRWIATSWREAQWHRDQISASCFRHFVSSTQTVLRRTAQSSKVRRVKAYACLYQNMY